MKRKHKSGGDLRPEYDFYRLKGVLRGKYAVRYQAGTNLVHLEPDVAKVFSDDRSVNQALRSLIRLARAQSVHAR